MNTESIENLPLPLVEYAARVNGNSGVSVVTVGQSIGGLLDKRLLHKPEYRSVYSDNGSQLEAVTIVRIDANGSRKAVTYVPEQLEQSYTVQECGMACLIVAAFTAALTWLAAKRWYSRVVKSKQSSSLSNIESIEAVITSRAVAVSCFGVLAWIAILIGMFTTTL